MISASAVSTIGLTYVSAGAWSVFNSSNLCTAGNLQANWTDITSAIENGYVTAINSCISELSGLYSSGAIVLYVDGTNGSNTNEGLASSSALYTISAAIAKIPPMLNHTAIINIYSATYDETVNIKGIYGSGAYLEIVGSTAITDNYVVSNVKVENCNMYILIEGLKASSVAANSFLIQNCSRVILQGCQAIATSTVYAGVTVQNSNASILSGVFSNRVYGLNAQMSRVYSDTNSGTGNTVGIRVGQAATVGKNSTQPAGTTTAESAVQGGVIR